VSFNHAVLFDAVAGAVPDRECIVWRDRRLTYGAVRDRVNRFANLLLKHGLTVHRPRAELRGWESGQDHVALYLYNGNEYLEATFGANEARAVPFNVNYRYVEEELAYLLNDAKAGAVVYHSTFAPTLAGVLPRLGRPPLLVQVADDSGHGLLPGAVDYEEALAASAPEKPDTAPDPDDLYILYTGGTTGMPKGTLWTQAGIYEAALAPVALGVDRSSLETVAASVADATGIRSMPTPPLMHGAAGWFALGTLLGGGTIVIPSTVDHLDAADVWTTVEREKVQSMVIVGDAFARPLAEELAKGNYDTSSLMVMATGGAITSPVMKARLLELLPSTMIIDVGGASETGSQLSQISSAGADITLGVFTPNPTTCVIDDERQKVLEPGHDGIGWLARRGAIPLGYLGDRAKTEATFPMIAGEPMSVPGDRARLRADGMVELLGRESMTINSGGEKVFAEEVEQALIRHPAVVDALVVGRPSERWGQEIIGVVQLDPAAAAVTDTELIEATSPYLARYKRPKAIVRAPQVQRSPSGKADYAWAKAQATQATSTGS
jgi:3-oxocholest-4-en-26-oate---CoA ligase